MLNTATVTFVPADPNGNYRSYQFEFNNINNYYHDLLIGIRSVKPDYQISAICWFQGRSNKPNFVYDEQSLQEALRLNRYLYLYVYPLTPEYQQLFQTNAMSPSFTIPDIIPKFTTPPMLLNQVPDWKPPFLTHELLTNVDSEPLRIFAPGILSDKFPELVPANSVTVDISPSSVDMVGSPPYPQVISHPMTPPTYQQSPPSSAPPQYSPPTYQQSPPSTAPPHYSPPSFSKTQRQPHGHRSNRHPPYTMTPPSYHMAPLPYPTVAQIPMPQIERDDSNLDEDSGGTLLDVPQLHHGITCDACQRAIYGVRFKCQECPDYDLCEQCKKSGKHRHHKMTKMVKRGPSPQPPVDESWKYPSTQVQLHKQIRADGGDTEHSDQEPYDDHPRWSSPPAKSEAQRKGGWSARQNAEK